MEKTFSENREDICRIMHMAVDLFVDSHKNTEHAFWQGAIVELLVFFDGFRWH